MARSRSYRKKTGKKLRIPMHRDLAELLTDLPRRATTTPHQHQEPPVDHGWVPRLLVEWDGAARYGGAPPGRLAFHGLRKSAVVFLLKAGCTDAEVSAITGQSRQMVEHYARQVNQEKPPAMEVLKWEKDGLMDGG